MEQPDLKTRLSENAEALVECRLPEKRAEIEALILEAIG